MIFARLVLSMAMLLTPCLGADEVFNVCEILAHLQDFSCRPVHVKARLASSVDTWLTGENCSKPIKVKTVVFQDLIALEWPSSRLVGCYVDFKDDEKSIRELQDVLGNYKPGRQRIDIIVDGVVETRHPPYGLVGNEGQQIGFGHLGGAPAQIIVKRVISLKVTPVKASE